MERVIFIEVRDEHGKLLERFKATNFPLRIGRAYDNDLIVDDPYVCAHHCEIVIDEAGRVLANDLASVNGTHVMGAAAPSGQIEVSADSQLRIGHTTLRFRFADQVIEATRPDQIRRRQWHEWPPRTLAANLAVLLVAALIMTVSNYFESYQEFEFGRYFFREQIPALMAVAGWAGIWAIVSRVTEHRFDFTRHATILVTILLVMYLSDTLIEFLKFGFATQWPLDVLNLGISGVAIALLLYWHLRLSSALKPVRLMMASSLVAVLMIGLLQFNDYLDSKEFRNTPFYPTALKPPSFQMVESKSVDDFLRKAELLRANIDSELDEQRAKAAAQPVSDSRPE